MHVVKNYDELKEVVGYSFEREKNNSKIVGLLFAQQDSFTEDEILKNLIIIIIVPKKQLTFFVLAINLKYLNLLSLLLL